MGSFAKKLLVLLGLVFTLLAYQNFDWAKVSVRTSEMVLHGNSVRHVLYGADLNAAFGTDYVGITSGL